MWRTCAEEEDTNMVYRLCCWEFEVRMGIVDLLEVGLEQTSCDDASEHGVGLELYSFLGRAEK